MRKPTDIDKLDRQILSILMRDAKMPYTDIAKKLFVSGGTVHVRMRKLEQLGVVKEANLKVDYSQLGYDISAFIGIYLDKSSMYQQVISSLQSIPEVVAAHYTTGNYAIFARVVCKDTQHLREVLSGKIQSIPGIQRTETFISLEESINRPINILEEGEEFD
ncbi:MAG: winged helix-turn-helix transcriptional regulator [Saprospiraceae bacterium]|nr:winged helix-turn-helix transcriptional regulator [Saprospiraceae bacterium]